MGQRRARELAPHAGAGNYCRSPSAGRITADVAYPTTYGHDTAGLVEWFTATAGAGDDDLDASNLYRVCQHRDGGWAGTGDQGVLERDKAASGGPARR